MPDRAISYGGKFSLSGFNPVLVLTGVAILILSFAKSQTVSGHLIDGQGFALGRDFVNFWHYGRAAWLVDPALWFTDATYNAVLDQWIAGYDYPDQRFSYPPHYLLLAAPFGLLDYYPALFLYTAGGLFCFHKFVVAPFENSAAARCLWLAPALLVTLICGQASLYLAALFAVIYRVMDRRPILAGVLIGLLTVKPQVGLLFPLFLALTARWRIFAVAAAATLGFLALSILVHGPGVWEAFLFSGVGEQSKHMAYAHPFTRGLMPTVLVNFVNMGVPVSIAAVVHGAVSMMVAGVLIFVLRKSEDRFVQYAVFVCASFLVTPYLMVYDTMVLVWVAMMLAMRLEESGEGAAMRSPVFSAAYKLLMVLAPLGVVLSYLGLPGSALVLLALFGCVAAQVPAVQKAAFRAARLAPGAG